MILLSACDRIPNVVKNRVLAGRRGDRGGSAGSVPGGPDGDHAGPLSGRRGLKRPGGRLGYARAKAEQRAGHADVNSRPRAAAGVLPQAVPARRARDGLTQEAREASSPGPGGLTQEAREASSPGPGGLIPEGPGPLIPGAGRPHPGGAWAAHSRGQEASFRAREPYPGPGGRLIPHPGPGGSSQGPGRPHRGGREGSFPGPGGLIPHPGRRLIPERLGGSFPGPGGLIPHPGPGGLSPRGWAAHSRGPERLISAAHRGSREGPFPGTGGLIPHPGRRLIPGAGRLIPVGPGGLIPHPGVGRHIRGPGDSSRGLRGSSGGLGGLIPEAGRPHHLSSRSRGKPA
jgi:hypothetical protein